jgi:PII-like signaling protein
MELKGTAKLLRIFFGEADKIHHTPMHETIVQAARSAGMAGATVWRGILAFGPTSRVRTTKVLDLSTDLPIILEIVDEESKIDAFMPKLHDLFEQAGCGGLITIEKVEVIHYVHGKKAT